MEAFVMCVLILLALVNLVLAIGTSIVLTKVFEIVKTQSDVQETAAMIRRQSQGLLDIETPQVPYSLRR